MVFGIKCYTELDSSYVSRESTKSTHTCEQGEQGQREKETSLTQVVGFHCHSMLFPMSPHQEWYTFLTTVIGFILDPLSNGTSEVVALGKEYDRHSGHVTNLRCRVQSESQEPQVLF